MPYATSPGMRIYYQVEGSGVPLLLHPGFVGTLTDWYDFGYVDALKGQYRLVLIDPRGQGGSDKPHETASYSAAARVADVLAVLDDLRIERAHFLGYSMGGSVGFRLGQQAPERLLSLILGGASPPSGLPNVAWAELFRQGMEIFVADVEWSMGPAPAAVRARWLASDPAALAAAALVRGPGLEADLGTMQLPILLYCGDQDPNYAGAQQAASLLPQATFVPLPGLTHLEGLFNGAAVVPHILAFLHRISAVSDTPPVSA